MALVLLCMVEWLSSMNIVKRLWRYRRHLGADRADDQSGFALYCKRMV